MRIIIDIPDFDRPLDLDEVIFPGDQHTPPVTLREIIQQDVMSAINNDSALAMAAIWAPHYSAVTIEQSPHAQRIG